MNSTLKAIVVIAILIMIIRSPQVLESVFQTFNTLLTPVPK
jgi:hypothetical protein